MTDHKLLICAVLAIAAHFGLAFGLDQLPPHESDATPRTVTVRITELPPQEPPPEPEHAKPPPEPPKPEPPKPVRERPKIQTATAHDIVPHETPQPDTAPTPGPTMETPIYGTELKSTSQGGTVPVPAGNTKEPTAAPQPAAVKPLAQPVAAYEVTKMPMPHGRCSGKYTDEARAAAIEGTVVLDLIVDETGHAREISVVTGLGGGLTKAAIAALAGCTFAPGEKDGKAVPVRVRGFKIRFVLADP